MHLSSKKNSYRQKKGKTITYAYSTCLPSYVNLLNKLNNIGEEAIDKQLETLVINEENCHIIILQKEVLQNATHAKASKKDLICSELADKRD